MLLFIPGMTDPSEISCILLTNHISPALTRRERRCLWQGWSRVEQTSQEIEELKKDSPDTLLLKLSEAIAAFQLFLI